MRHGKVIFDFYNKNSNVPKREQQAAGSDQSDVAHQSFDPIGHWVGIEETETGHVLAKSLVFVSFLIIAAFAFQVLALATMDVYSITITQSNTYILFQKRCILCSHF